MPLSFWTIRRFDVIDFDKLGKRRLAEATSEKKFSNIDLYQPKGCNFVHEVIFFAKLQKVYFVFAKTVTRFVLAIVEMFSTTKAFLIVAALSAANLASSTEAASTGKGDSSTKAIKSFEATVDKRLKELIAVIKNVTSRQNHIDKPGNYSYCLFRLAHIDYWSVQIWWTIDPNSVYHKQVRRTLHAGMSIWNTSK